MEDLSHVIPFFFMVRIIENTPVYVKYSTQQADGERAGGFVYSNHNFS